MKRSNNIISRLRSFFSRNGKGTERTHENIFYPGESPTSFRDRPLADYRTTIEKSLKAWREDPLARRIVNLTTQFSIGRGFRIHADDPAVDDFLNEL